MAMITMCSHDGSTCPVKRLCLRHTARKSPMYQSWAAFWSDEKLPDGTCKHFIHNKVDNNDNLLSDMHEPKRNRLPVLRERESVRGA